ncbi:hypothetical protein VTO58DRAFT_104143 [Aureobasidium pullulans]
MFVILTISRTTQTIEGYHRHFTCNDVDSGRHHCSPDQLKSGHIERFAIFRANHSSVQPRTTWTELA